MFSLAFLLAALPIVWSVSNGKSQAPFSPGFPYGTEPVRGVNLGGWLVLEPWITPTLFDDTGNPSIVDEWTFCLNQDPNYVRAALTQHWDTWITESDFQGMAEVGLNHVRIPIGYWAYDVGPGEPYIQGQKPYLLKAIGWAAKYNLKVIIDLHGAPGSQNGFDNSGQRKPSPQWQNNQTNIDRTNKIIKALAIQFQNQSEVVSVIAPLNEPRGFYNNVTRQYWLDSYRNVRSPTGQATNLTLLIHDAFQSLSYWNGFMPKGQYKGVAMDTHVYQMFKDESVSLNETEHIQSLCGKAGNLTKFNENQLRTIVAEWTPVMTDCAKHLNGVGVGARYDGTISGGAPVYGSCEGQTGPGYSFTTAYISFLQQTWEAQVITYEKASGWIQWTWKTEMADEWSYSAGIRYGWIPRDPTQRQHASICD